MPPVEMLPRRGDSAAADDPPSALSVALSLDTSSLCETADGESTAPVSLYDDPRVKVDVADDCAVVVGLECSLYFVAPSRSRELPSAVRSLEDARLADSREVQQLALVVDGATMQLEADEVISDVKWVDQELFCAGYSSGIVRVFNRSGKLWFEQKFHSLAVLKLDINFCSSVVLGSRHTTPQQPGDGELWILYEDSTVAIVQLSELFGQINSAVFGPAQASKFRKYCLRDQAGIVSAVPCGSVRPTIFQSHPRIGTYSVISAGAGPFLSFYQAGNDQNSIVHLAHIASAMATRAAGAMWNFAKSWGWGNSAGDGMESQRSGASYTHIGTAAIDTAAEHVAAPITSTRTISDEARRRCRVLVLSPNGRLAAISDTLGRIMLVDTTRMIIIRMWKGYRNAQCGWMQGIEGARRPQGLYLVIYSAQRGIVEVWRAQYGPKVYSFAVGACARLFTRIDPAARTAKCMILVREGPERSEVIELKPGLPSPSILMKYFTQNRLQEENFLLHQLIGGLHAFAKKHRQDTKQSMSDDVLDSLLDEIPNLSSLATFEALLDTLLNPDMSILGAAFLLKALEKMQTALVSSMASRAPTGPEILLQWNLLWHHRLVLAFTGFNLEFQKTKHGALSNLGSNALMDAVSAKTISGEFSRMLPWLELFRRAGFPVDEDLRSRTRKSIESASCLNAWTFLEYFSMPFNDPELAHRRDILSLYEESDSREAFLREIFHTLKISVLRNFTSSARKDRFLAFLFVPVFSSVFAVQEVQRLHESLFLTSKMQSALFLEWYFSLPIGIILSLPAPTQSSVLQRWLQPYFLLSVTENDAMEGETPSEEFAPAESSLRRLVPCSEELQAIFTACYKSPRLFHAFILSEHCGWGETESAKHIEEATLGKFSSVGSGVRWKVLQDCIAETVHLSLRLGKVGRLSTESVEHVDELMRAIAVMQLNGGHEPGEDDLAQYVQERTRQPMGSDGVDNDAWVVEMEQYANVQQMKDWAAVLGAFPQFSDPNTLCCFRVSVLCAAWNSDRSDMQQLEDALLELDALSSLKMKVAMAVHIWEKYIRVHVVTLISFWEESAAGRKPQRGLQPQVARRFFGIIKDLLNILSTSIKTLQSASHARVEEEEEEDYEHRDSNDDNTEEDDEQDAVPDAHGDVHTKAPYAEFRLEFLVRSARWNCPVRDLKNAFRRRWPPSTELSSLFQTLRACNPHELSLTQVADHNSLILLLDSFAATAVTPVSIVRLFPNSGSHLCRLNTFVAPPQAASTNKGVQIQQERTNFLKQLIRFDESLGFSLAEAFGLSLETIQEEHVLFLYQSGKDELGDLWIDKMKRPERLVPMLGAVARARLSLILRRMKAETQYAMVMSVLPADIFAWVISNSEPPLVADQLVEQLDRTPSLTATHHLLLQCLSLMEPAGEEFDKISAMSALVKDVISQVKQFAASSNA